MTDFNRTQDYEDRRQNNTAQERAMRGPLEMVYTVYGLNPTYNTPDNSGILGKNAAEQWVKEQEMRGYDVAIELPGKGKVVVDEKAATSRKDAYTGLGTYSFEVSTQNNKNGDGWLFKEDAINSHYALVYPEMEKDTGELKKMEILIVPRDKVHEELAKYSLDSRAKAEEYFEKNIDYCRDGAQRAYPAEHIKMVKSVNKNMAEEPLNILIDRGWLRHYSDMVINVPSMDRIQQQYAEMQKQAERAQREAEMAAEKAVDRKAGVLLGRQANDAFQKAAKNFQKFRGKTLPEFTELTRKNGEKMQLEPGIKSDLRVTGFAMSGNSVILEITPEKSISNEQLYLAVGNQDKAFTPANLDFKDLSFKQQFCLKTETVTKENGTIIKAERQPENNERNEKIPDKPR